MSHVLGGSKVRLSMVWESLMSIFVGQHRNRQNVTIHTHSYTQVWIEACQELVIPSQVRLTTAPMQPQQ